MQFNYLKRRHQFLSKLAINCFSLMQPPLPQGTYVWINTGISNGNSDNFDDNSIDMNSFDRFMGYSRGGRGSKREERVESLATITTLGPQEELVMDILRQGKALITKNAHVTTSIYVASLRQGERMKLLVTLTYDVYRYIIIGDIPVTIDMRLYILYCLCF